MDWSAQPYEEGCFNTFTFWEGLRPHRNPKLERVTWVREFQHLYLLGRSATSLLGMVSSYVIVMGFNTFTFWEGLRPAYESKFGKHHQSVGFNTFTFWEGLRLNQTQIRSPSMGIWFQHLYLLGRSATSGISPLI